MVECIMAAVTMRKENVCEYLTGIGRNKVYKHFHSMKWFAIHVKRFREALAAASVSAYGIDVFLPLVKVDSSERVVIKVESKPLFPSYLFAKFAPESSLGLVEQTRGVLHVIKSGGIPISIDDQVLLEIQSRVESDGLIRLEKRSLKPGDVVSIEEGVFAGMMGRVENERDDGRRVAILLETLWQARVVIKRQFVELATA
jgi:transcriptional antiterminator RfaH